MCLLLVFNSFEGTAYSLLVIVVIGIVVHKAEICQCKQKVGLFLGRTCKKTFAIRLIIMPLRSCKQVKVILCLSDALPDFR